MAGERKGKTYEAVAHAALTLLARKGRVKGEVFWNQKPDGMSIEPDLTIGKDKDHPDVCILITQSGSAKESEKKGWRNLGELIELKTVLPTTPKTLNLMFDSVAKEDLKKVQEAAFDGQLIVGDLGYGDDLQAWVDANLSELPTHYLKKSATILDLYDSKSDPGLRRLLDRLAADLAELLAKTNPPMEQLWKLERARVKGKAPRAKTTYVRRGSTALLVVQDRNPLERLYDGKKVRAEEVPEYAYALGFARKFESTAQPSSTELQNLFDLFRNDPASLDLILKSAPSNATISGWIQSLRNLSHLVFMGVYVVQEFDHLCDPAELARQFRSLHDDPTSLVDEHEVPDGWAPSVVWLLPFLVELIKQSTGKANGYGIAQLGRDCVAAGCAGIGDLSGAGQFGGGFGLSGWIARKPTSPFRDDLVDCVATVLANKLRELGKNAIQSLVETSALAVSANVLESKLMTYRMFEPLAVLIEGVVRGAKRVDIKSCFAEAGGIGGQAGKTTVLKAKSTLINWQSCHDSHTNDKKKELCGRAVALRYTWDPKSKTFKPRPGVSKLILVLDGTWRSSDLEALVRAGWDEIYYPDEMDKLSKAVI